MSKRIALLCLGAAFAAAADQPRRVAVIVGANQGVLGRGDLRYSYRDAGAVRQGETDDERLYTVLQCGTARMGPDPATSVVNAACEAHEVKGLFVADSSTFCSSGSAPFTLTIMANALRVATGIAQRMRRREL